MFKNTFFKEWRFYFKIGFGLLLTATLLYTWLNPLINGITVTEQDKLNWKNWSWFVNDKGDYTLNLLSFFTIQTNIFVALWFILGGIFLKREGKSDSLWFGQYMSLAITTYITITGIVFNTMLLPMMNIQGVFGWFTNIIEHMICPLVTIIYFLFLMRRDKKSILPTKLFWKKHLWKYYFYPIIWAIVMLIRGEFRYQAGKAWPYQYFFLNVHQSSFGIPGVVWLIMAIILVASLIFALSTLFNLITFKLNKKIPDIK